MTTSRLYAPLVRYGSFEDLLAGAAGRRLAGDQLSTFLFSRGRVLLQGQAGKSRVLCLQAITDIVGASDEVARFTIPAFKLADAEHESLIDWLLERAASGRVLLVLDGLDEVPPSFAFSMLDAIESATQQDPQLAVVVADRLGRRPIRTGRWALVGADEGQPHPVSNEADTSGSGTRTRVDEARAVLDDLGVSYPQPGEANPAATAALEWLRNNETTAAATEDVVRWFGARFLEAQSQSGLLVVEGESVRFQNVLLHMYFAAVALSASPAKWTTRSWSDATLGGANLLALEMLLELVDTAAAETIIRSVDAWSYQASAALLANPTVRHRVPADLRTALTLLLGHRRFAVNPNTAVIAADLLRIQGDVLAGTVLAVTDRDELTRLVPTISVDTDWWREWSDAFTGRDVARQVMTLTSDDNVIGWTAANVLAGHRLAEGIEESIRQVAASSDPNVRWRAVHALQGSSDERTATACLTLFLEDNDEWVRYGALRSFLQVVSQLADVSVRAALCEELAAASEVLNSNHRWVREIERAGQIEDAPPDWPVTFGAVVEAMWSVSASVHEEDRWRVVSASLRTDWSANHPAAFRPMPESDEQQ